MVRAHCGAGLIISSILFSVECLNVVGVVSRSLFSQLHRLCSLVSLLLLEAKLGFGCCRRNMRIETRRRSLRLLSFSLKATPFTILTLAAKADEDDEYEETQRDTDQKAK